MRRLVPAAIAAALLAFPAAGTAQFDGSLNAGFDGPAGGGNGKFLHSFGDQDDQARDVLVQPDGKVLVVGFTDIDPGAPQELNLAVARFNGANGSLDATFDGDTGTGNGDFTMDLSSVANGETRAESVTLDSQGRIVIGGSVDVAGSAGDNLVVRLNPATGARDLSFGGGDGFATAQFTAGDDSVGAVATDSSDRPVTVGTSSNDFTVARYESDGDPDSTFGSAGLKIVGIEPGTQDAGNSVLIQPDGKIVVGARSHIAATSFDWGVARLMPADGSLDPTFDGPAGNGNGAFRLPLSTGQDVGQAMEMQGTDKILIAGEAGPSANAGIARIDVSDGDFDDSFDGDGLLVTDFGTGGEQFFDLAVDSKGRIVAVGSASSSGSTDFAAARYSADGVPDPFFDGDSGTGNGQVVIPFAATDVADALGIAPDGDLVLAGASGTISSDDFALARLNIDLTEPNTFTSGPSGPISDPNPSFSITSNETASSVQCTIDTVPVACAIGAGQQFGPFADGQHTLTAAAVDVGGNVDSVPATRSFTVDTVQPNGSITGGTGLTNDSTPTISFASDEAGTSFQCKIDPPVGPAGSFAPCTSPLTAGPLPDGASTITVRNTDAAGNTDASDAVGTVTVDTVAPSAAITGPRAKLKTRKRRARASFSFSSSDPSATLECSLDGAPFGPCASPFAATLRLGSHTFSVRARDAAGNVSPVAARAVKVKRVRVKRRK
jgi:uncharacterized delta-60 repeat protein